MAGESKRIGQLIVGRLIVPGLLVVFCIWYVSIILKLPQGPGAEGPLGPSFMPWLWVSLLAVFALTEPGFDYIRSRKNTPQLFISQKNLIDAVILTFLLVGFALSIQRIGFSAATTVFLAISIRWCGIRSWKIIIPYAILFSIVTNYIFHHFLQVPLPQGWLS